jgi:hypothetical protein
MTIRPDVYTRGTEVLMSFGAKDGGYDLAVDLRQGLMNARGWTEPCAVYLDGPSTTTLTEVNKKQIQFDCGESYWKVLFKAAMLQAKAMVFVVTPQWARSHWCAQEHRWFEDIRRGLNAQQTAIPHHLPIVLVGFEEAFSLLSTGKTDLILAQGAARVSSRLAALDPSQRLVRKSIRHADGALVIVPKGSVGNNIATKVNAALRTVGVF